MVEAGGARRTILDAGKRRDSEPMMLVIVSHEREHLVLEHDFGLQHSLVPIDHLFELVGAQNRMREFGGDDFLRRAIARITAHVSSPKMASPQVTIDRCGRRSNRSEPVLTALAVGYR